MSKLAEAKIDIEPVVLTDGVAAMADYVRSPEGHAAIARGLADISEGRVIIGRDALADELNSRAAKRRA